MSAILSFTQKKKDWNDLPVAASFSVPKNFTRHMRLSGRASERRFPKGTGGFLGGSLAYGVFGPCLSWIYSKKPEAFHLPRVLQRPLKETWRTNGAMQKNTPPQTHKVIPHRDTYSKPCPFNKPTRPFATQRLPEPRYINTSASDKSCIFQFGQTAKPTGRCLRRRSFKGFVFFRTLGALEQPAVYVKMLWGHALWIWIAESACVCVCEAS